MAEYTPTSILVTGGAGFIGSHVANALQLAFPSAHIVILDLLHECASLRNLDGFGGRFVQGDVRDADLVLDILENDEIDTVMHFAAHTHVDNSFGNSLEFTRMNTYGTHVLLEACRAYGRLKRFVNVSTDEVYGETFEKVTEDDGLMEPTNPYAAAKAGAELMARAYHTSFGLPVITTRGNNVYGPGQFPEKLVPKFLVRGQRGLPLEVHGDGSARRSFVFITDVADAFILIVKKGRVGDIYNIGISGPGFEKRVMDVARDVAAMYAVPIKHVRDRAFNDRRYFICDRKMMELGWTPKVSWTEGLATTAAWYADVGIEYWMPDIATRALEAHPVVHASEK